MTILRIPIVALLCAMMLPAAAQTPDLQSEACAITMEFVQRLGAELREALATSGPGYAISVCRESAPRIAGELSRRTGWRVTRVSLRTRNPLLGQPDRWEQQILQTFDRAVFAGGAAEALEVAETVDEPGGRYFRYMRALPVQVMCLGCHGAVDGLSDPIREQLARDYPNDHATGYETGDVRGAVSVKRRLPDSR